MDDPRKGAYHGNYYTLITEDRMPIPLHLADIKPGDSTAEIENISVVMQSGNAEDEIRSQKDILEEDPTEIDDPRKGSYHGSDYTLISEDRMPIPLHLADIKTGDPTTEIENISVDMQSGNVEDEIGSQKDILEEDPTEMNDPKKDACSKGDSKPEIDTTSTKMQSGDATDESPKGILEDEPTELDNLMKGACNEGGSATRTHNQCICRQICTKFIPWLYRHI